MKIPKAILRILRRLETGGFSAWLVGGGVRDALYHPENVLLPDMQWTLDYDIATSAMAETVQCLFGDMQMRLDGKQYGTIKLQTEGYQVDITTFRTEDTYADGRRPAQVRFGSSLAEDLKRRDFTMNAVAWHPAEGFFDPMGGIGDLQAGVLRAIGEPAQRFREDGLRILRAVRLCAQHAFTIEAGTREAMYACIDCLSKLSADRVREELTKLLCGRFVGRVLMEHRAIIAAVLPEVTPMFDLDQQSGHHKYDVWEHTVHAVSHVPATPLLRWVMLLHDSGKPACKEVDEKGVGHFGGHARVSESIARQVLARLRFPEQEATQIALLVRQHDNALGVNGRYVRRRLSHLGEERFRLLLCVQKSDWYGKRVMNRPIYDLMRTQVCLENTMQEHYCFHRGMLAVNGADLMRLGMQKRSIGRLMQVLLEDVLEEPLHNNKPYLLELARKRMEDMG